MQRRFIVTKKISKTTIRLLCPNDSQPYAIWSATLVTWLPAHVRVITPTNCFAASAKPNPELDTILEFLRLLIKQCALQFAHESMFAQADSRISMRGTLQDSPLPHYLTHSLIHSRTRTYFACRHALSVTFGNFCNACPEEDEGYNVVSSVQ